MRKVFLAAAVAVVAATSANAGGMNAVVQQPVDTGVVAVTPTSSVPGYVLPLVILGVVAAVASSSGT
jgi:hypothetical protein